MSEIKRKIDEELKNIAADPSGIGKIMELAKKEEQGMPMRKNGRTIMKVAGIAAAITMLSVGTVFGVEYYQRTYKYMPNIFDDHLNSPGENAPVYEIPTEQSAEKVTAPDSTRNLAELKMEWGKYTVEPHRAIFSVTLRTKDGSPIVEENENKVPAFHLSGFGEVTVTVDGKTTSSSDNGRGAVIDPTNPNGGFGASVYAFCVGSTDDLSGVAFEVQYINYDMDLSGKEIRLEFEDLNVDYYLFESIGAKSNLAALLAGGVAADASDFAPAAGTDYDYVLQPGKNHIAFSEKYPDCYIDNFGFVSRKMDGVKDFYVTVVCEGASRDELSQMTFQSLLCGMPAAYKTEVLADGRFQYRYDVNGDWAYWNVTNGGTKHMDTTMEHIAALIPKKLLGMEEGVRVAGGTWSNSFVLDGQMDTFVKEVSAPVSSISNTSSFTVTSVQYNGLRIKMEGTANEDFDFKDFGLQGEYAPIAVMKDGTRVLVDGKGFEGGTADLNTGKVEVEFAFRTIVDPQQIAAIEWHGVTVWSME